MSDKPRLAVLPFENQSGAVSQLYFSDGITEDIMTELSPFRLLTVMARHSYFAIRGNTASLPEIARGLGVDYVVAGSLRRQADRVRISTKLIAGSTGTQIWAEQFDRDVEDIFSVQDEVTRRVAASVSGRLDTIQSDRVLRLSPDGL